MQDPQREQTVADSRRGSGAKGNVHVVCPHCAAINRVPRARLADGARCGSCKQPVLEGRAFELTQSNFDRHLASNDLPLIVDFWAPWCGPCRMMAPAYEEAAARLGSRVRLARLDTEAVPEVAARFGIRSIPTLIAFKHGHEVARQTGAASLPHLLEWINRYV